VSKSRDFSTVPIRAIWDDSLSGLDLRVLICISLHDGMSLRKGSGAGCYATNDTLQKEIRCSYTSLSKSITRLVEKGYLQRERQADKKSRTTLRVIFHAEDSCSFEQLTDDEIVGETDNHFPETVARSSNYPDETVAGSGNQKPKLVVHDFSETRGNLPKTDTQKITLNYVKDIVETLEKDSAEAARFASREQLDELESKHGAGGLLAMFERAFSDDPAALDLNLCSEWLNATWESWGGVNEGIAQQALRLSEMVELYQQFASDAPDPNAIDDPDLIQTFWKCGGTTGRRELIARHGMTVGELQRFSTGNANLPSKKITALAKSIRSRLAAEPRRAVAS
jgi:hypothetical protein